MSRGKSDSWALLSVTVSELLRLKVSPELQSDISKMGSCVFVVFYLF